MRQEQSECSYILAKLLHDLQDWDAALAAAQALYLMRVQMDVMVSAAVYSTVAVARSRIWGRMNPQFCFDFSGNVLSYLVRDLCEWNTQQDGEVSAGNAGSSALILR